MNYLPFNLERAKAGAKIVCRDGTPAKFIAHVLEAKPDQRVVVLIRGQIRVYSENGSYGSLSDDLVMAPVEKTVWVNFYGDVVSGGDYLNGEKELSCSAGFESKERADEVESWASRTFAPRKVKRIACKPITFVEGEGL